MNTQEYEDLELMKAVRAFREKFSDKGNMLAPSDIGSFIIGFQTAQKDLPSREQVETYVREFGKEDL